MNCMAMNSFWQKLRPEGVNDFWGFHNLEAKIRNILVLAHNVSEERFPNLEDTMASKNSQCPCGNLTKENHVSDQEDEEGSDMWRDFSWLPVLLRRPPDGGRHSHFFEVDHFKDRCLKLEHKLQAVMAPSDPAYKGTHKKQSNLRSMLSSLSTVPPHILLQSR